MTPDQIRNLKLIAEKATHLNTKLQGLATLLDILRDPDEQVTEVMLRIEYRRREGSPPRQPKPPAKGKMVKKQSSKAFQGPGSEDVTFGGSMFDVDAGLRLLTDLEGQIKHELEALTPNTDLLTAEKERLAEKRRLKAEADANRSAERDEDDEDEEEEDPWDDEEEEEDEDDDI